MAKKKNQRKKSKKHFANDGLGNIVKGIGGKKDTLQNTTFVRTNLDLNVNHILAEELYLYNWLVGNICDIPADEATRAWCELSTSKENQPKLQKIQKLLEKLQLKQKIRSALAFADLFGGCALYAVVNDGQTQDKPLRKNNIKKGSFAKIRVLEPSYLQPIYNGFDEPTHYHLRGNKENLIIHESRLCIFKGLEITQRKKQELRFWGGSKAQRAIEPIIASDTGINAIVNMMTETNVNVYKLEGLTDLAIDDADEDAIKKIELIDKAKSYLNAILLDSKDDFLKKSNDFKDLHQIYNSMLINVSGSAQIPATLLFGRSPDGMNATGTSDLENFFKRIHTIQTDKIQPKLFWFLALASYSLLAEDISEDVSIFWNPLQQETKKEIAEREKAEAETDAKYIEKEVFTKDEVRDKVIQSNRKYFFLQDKKNEEQK